MLRYADRIGPLPGAATLWLVSLVLIGCAGAAAPTEPRQTDEEAGRTAMIGARTNAVATASAQPTGGSSSVSGARVPRPPLTADGELAKMAAAIANVRSFRGRVTAELGSGETKEVVYEVVKPDRVRVQHVRGPWNQFDDVVRVGDKIYMTDQRRGKWYHAATIVVRDVYYEVDAFRVFDIDGANRYTSRDVTGQGAARCREWTVSATKPERSGTVCVGVADNLPHRFTSSDGKTRTTLSDWNQPIRIEPPI